MNARRPAGTYTLKEAANELNVGHRKMINKLREQKVLTVERFPYVQWMRGGFFYLQETPFTLPNTNIQKMSSRTLVTISGLTLIRSVMDDQPLAPAANPQEKKHNASTAAPIQQPHCGHANQ